MPSRSLVRVSGQDKVVLAPVQLETDVVGTLDFDHGGVGLGDEGEVLTTTDGVVIWAFSGVLANASIADQVIS